MKNEIKTCPFCGETYTGYPALSRRDNKTEICPDCGIREASETVGMSKALVAQIIEKTHKIAANA